MSEYQYADGDEVVVYAGSGITGTGRVVGCASAAYPAMGRSYIVSMDHSPNIPNPTYPFRVAVISESHLAIKK